MEMTGISARPVPAAEGAEGLAQLKAFVESARSMLVLTGAGCSTESGIPDYRDARGDWKRPQPVQFQDFLQSPATRRRYWARSLLGWKRVAGARPNAAHRSLAHLESRGLVHCLITQNVDGLHQKAGSRNVVDLHGRLDVVVCLECNDKRQRAVFQAELERLNPHWDTLAADSAPDGDVDLDGVDCTGFRVPACAICGGVLKPGVVFFGEPVPRSRTARALAGLDAADAMLVVGSSLMVWSGYRLAREAARRALALAAVNIGRTRADDLISLKVEGRCGDILSRVLQ